MGPASFVALGDSFTEGLDDVRPDGSHRGWADLVAERLAVGTPDFRYANLAVRGRLLSEIVAEQVPAAVALGADLVSLAGGTNDVLRRRYDPAAVHLLLDEAVGTLAASGARVVLFTGTDPSRRLPGARRLLPRIAALNEAAARVAGAYDTVLVDMSGDRAFDDRRLWSEDRLHLSAPGHRRVADAVLTALGLDPATGRPAAAGSLPTPGADMRLPWRQARLDDVRWARRHLAPWVHRRITGRSSGDARVPKRPELAPLRMED